MECTPTANKDRQEDSRGKGHDCAQHIVGVCTEGVVHVSRTRAALHCAGRRYAPRATLGIHSFIHFTSLHFTSLHFTSLHFTSLHFTSLHFTSLHFTSLHFTSFHFISFHFIHSHTSLVSEPRRLRVYCRVGRACDVSECVASLPPTFPRGETNQGSRGSTAQRSLRMPLPLDASGIRNCEDQKNSEADRQDGKNAWSQTLKTSCIKTLHLAGTPQNSKRRKNGQNPKQP